jgi:hypothetical protein
MATYLRPFPAAAAAFAPATRWLRFCACALALGATVVSAQQVKDIFPASTQLPNAVLGRFYSITLTAVTEPAGLPVDWNTDEGCLDGSGLEFIFPDGSSNATTIQGTASTLGTFECTVTATIFLDTGNSSITKTYMVRVVNPCPLPQITSGDPPAITAGVPYSFTVTATGKPPLTYTAMGLPPGLTIGSATGVITGTTNVVGRHVVSVMVSGCGRSALRDFTVVVNPPPPAVVALSLMSQPNPAIFGQPVTALAHATDGASAPTGNVLLCVIAPGQFCAAPVGAPPPGTDPSLIPPLLTAPLDANGNATFTLNGLLIQNYVLSASYGGDATHQPATAGPVDQFVIKGLLLPPAHEAVRPSRAAQGDPPAPAASIPTLSWAALALLALAIAGVGAVRLRRRPLDG